MNTTAQTLREYYDALLAHFGPQQWWPADSAFEVMVGAVLTQNTNWQNVEKALANLRARDLLEPKRLYAVPPAELAQLIRPAGYYNIKTKRLRALLDLVIEQYEGDITAMQTVPAEQMRAELLAVKGVGPETADSIMLYAFGHARFVVDAYTHRILQRHNLCAEETSYEELQELFEDALPADAQLYNEYHALIVSTGKEFCRPRNPRCSECPLQRFLP